MKENNLITKGTFSKLAQQQTQIPTNNCRINAKNDVEAVRIWLDEYFEKPATFRTYKKEAERFIVWLHKMKNQTLGALDRDTVEHYINFLKDPSKSWCITSDDKSIWKPFRKPLSPTSIKASLTILNSMMKYFLEAGYVSFNAFSLVRKKGRFKGAFSERAIKVSERILTNHEWSMFLLAVKEENESTKEELQNKQRLNFLVQIMFYLGLRVEEVSNAQWQDFRKINDKWWFFVSGKGDRLGKIPVNSRLLQQLMVYRTFLKLLPLPKSNEDIYIFPGKKGRGLSTRQISNLIKEIAIKASKSIQEKNPESAQKLLRMSPHWLRHLAASKQDLAGISFTNIRENMRHSDEQTTRQYVHSHDETRHQEMENLNIQPLA